MNAPTVSIILPSFNRLKYLRPAVESVFAQSFADWELIIADDGSDEKTRAFIATVALRPRVKVLWLSHAGTPAVTRNAALHEARGEYVAFLDSDDLWMPSKLEVQMRSLLSRSARRWSYSAFTIVDAAGAPRPGDREASWPCPDGWIFERLLAMQAIVATPTVVACRALVASLGGFDERLLACSDYDLWLRLASRSEVDVIKEPLAQVRRHGEHFADDVTSLESWRTVLEKTRATGLERSVDCIVQRQRAQVSAKLATRHAIGGNHDALWQTLFESWPYSWRYPRWWIDAVAAAIRAYAPDGVRRAVRGYRRRGVDAGVQP
jgi:glycosyltransferase involved in cell wall biosynthesis